MDNVHEMDNIHGNKSKIKFGFIGQQAYLRGSEEENKSHLNI